MTNVTNQKIGGVTAVGIGNTESRIVKHEIDIAAAVASGLATTELVNVIAVPADCYVEVLQVENATALSLGASPDVELGDTGDNDRFVATHSTLTAGSNHTIEAAGKGYLYTAADTISAKITGGTLASGKIRYVFRLTDTSPNVAAVAPTR